MAELQQKYTSLVGKGNELGINFSEINENDGKLQVRGVAPFQMQKDLFWDTLKQQPNWENEVDAEIKVSNTDYYGEYTIQSGDTLSAIAKRYLGDSNKYSMIVDANPDHITDPDKIRAGDTIKLPMAAALH